MNARTMLNPELRAKMHEELIEAISGRIVIQNGYVLDAQPGRLTSQ